MPSSTSSQESRVRAGRRILLERRPRFCPRHDRLNAMKLPLPPPLTMSEFLAKYSTRALSANPAYRERAQEKASWEADRSVHAPLHGVGAAEDDDDDFDLLVVGRPMRRKNVLPSTHSKGVEVGDKAKGKGAPTATPAPVPKQKGGIVERKVDSAAAQGPFFSKGDQADKEAARVKARSAHEKSIKSQIRLLENQVAISLKVKGLSKL